MAEPSGEVPAPSTDGDGNLAATVKKNHVCLVKNKQPLLGGAKKRGGEELTVNCKETEKDDIINISGGTDIKSKYKKTLNKKTLEDLRKMAKGKGIKITTKKDGKSVYLKKSSIINKLCNFKHPKKPVKKPVKKTVKKTIKKTTKRK